MAVAFVGCEPTEPEVLSRLATVEGQLDTIEGVGGSAYLFLYRPNEGPPTGPGVPAFVTAISGARLKTDPRFVFSNVKPNPWSLYGLLDTTGHFDPNIDVLSQPSAGDRVGDAVPINVQPGRGLRIDYSARSLVIAEPPAFHLEGAGADVTLNLVNAMTPLTLVADSMEIFDSKKTHFRLGLVDVNRDGRPDVGSDGVPVLSLTVFLHWLPRPGQAAAGTNVVVPTVYNPAPFLNTLNGSLGAVVAVQTLQVFPLPQAQVLSVDEKGVSRADVYGAPPFGDYELVAVMPGGQFWRVPNQLGPTIASQAVRLHSDVN